MHWRLNMIGPAWFRRLRSAWGWYWSSDPMISVKDVKYILDRHEQRTHVRYLPGWMPNDAR